MKILLQRVKEASVTIENEVYSKISNGILIFIGVEKGDTIGCVKFLAKKIANLRMFPDKNRKMNKSIKDINGEILVVSQFTLCAECRKGTRPSFDKAELPISAEYLYDMFVKELKMHDINVQTGQFGATMDVSLINDGPVTFMINAEDTLPNRIRGRIDEKREARKQKKAEQQKEVAKV